MFNKKDTFLQILSHFIILLQNYPVSNTGAFQNLTSYMTVKLKVESSIVL